MRPFGRLDGIRNVANRELEANPPREDRANESMGVAERTNRQTAVSTGPAIFGKGRIHFRELSRPNLSHSQSRERAASFPNLTIAVERGAAQLTRFRVRHESLEELLHRQTRRCDWKPYCEESSPRAVVVINGTRYVPKSFKITQNAHGVSDTATIELPLSAGKDLSVDLFRGERTFSPIGTLVHQVRIRRVKILPRSRLRLALT